MRSLHGLNRAIFAVPLALSTLVLRVLGVQPAAKSPEQQQRRAGVSGRAATRRRAARKKSPAPPTPGPDIDAVRRELTAVLDAHEGSRQVFRYLAHFEAQFARKGLRALERISVKHLRRALAQFEAIVTNWSSPALADLRSRMAVTLADRDSAGALWQAAPTISKAYAPQPMPMVGHDASLAAARTRMDRREVEIDDEISLSRFEAAMGEWQSATARPASHVPPNRSCSVT